MYICKSDSISIAIVILRWKEVFFMVKFELYKFLLILSFASTNIIYCVRAISFEELETHSDIVIITYVVMQTCTLFFM
jgi:hypothetical protein